ncbi:type 1 glutamine amidotransferase domain-containing protein [Aestuariicella hydrocarbonica]|uniref:Type 1 glutamine amidotransferase domain-containing protein n=1 Tax=Pseudomaricurvus hydrocarbonicus TaxID=1470433 RepID=A0A9E5T322_9GAMM|nr:type 1 glutamine amidotransferase domain-containing protein [Aestuariicella hydrocarbonica]NHO68371.1 type 1 glutamine amidotransferase domain-containing protein [Aestuariicella hydrocarbonica]
MKKVLILVTNHATLGETDEENGTFAPELTHALQVILKAGLGYDIASIQGGPAPVYGLDIEWDSVNSEMLADSELQHRLKNTIPAAQLNMDDYAAIFYPGGFGLLSDLASNEAVAKLSAQLYENGGVIAAVCHGPAGLLPITLSNGEKLLANKSVTGFTREEEVDYGTIDKIPYLLEESLTRSAARYSKVQPWGEFVIEDGRLITGQNPASAHAVGEAIVRQLG